MTATDAARNLATGSSTNLQLAARVDRSAADTGELGVTLLRAQADHAEGRATPHLDALNEAFVARATVISELTDGAVTQATLTAHARQVYSEREAIRRIAETETTLRG